MKILFVCTGNTCRSPYAHYLFKKMLEDKSLTQVEVDSAGTAAWPGMSLSELTQNFLEKEGVRHPKHRSQELTRERMQSADLVLTMENTHQSQILREFPQHAGKVHLLKEYVSHNGQPYPDIPDPIAQGETGYAQVMQTIKECLEKLAEKIQGERK